MVEDLRAQAVMDGMTTLRQDGIEKVLAGLCDMVQVRKVCIK
jgi:type II secretory ATPase GspE/PulE/Tfp pilus assembly ATPase PilB-like protein